MSEIDGWDRASSPTHPDIMRSFRRSHSRAASCSLLSLLLLFVVGFDLDSGELACEQAASHLADCCKEPIFDRTSCIQTGGCVREGDETLVSEEESDCIRELSCDEVAERAICERIADRKVMLETAKGPTIQELYRLDSLCE